MYLISSNPYSILVGQVLALSTFYRRGNKSSEKLSDLPKVKQLSNNGVGLEVRRFQLKTLNSRCVLSDLSSPHCTELFISLCWNRASGGGGQVQPHTRWGSGIDR